MEPCYGDRCVISVQVCEGFSISGIKGWERRGVWRRKKVQMPREKVVSQ